MISFKEYRLLIEGGAIKGPNGEISTPISTKDRKQTRNDIESSLSSLHDSFKNETGHHLFGKDKAALKSRTAFSGSTAHLVNKDISDEELHKHKPTMGDIDTQVPKEHLTALHKHMKPGLKFGKYTVIGSKKHGNEVSVIAKHDSGDHHQIDFEGVDYHKEEPTKFEQFAHNSTWSDIKNGIKGAAHKQLLNATGGDSHKFSITHGLNKRIDDKKASAVEGEKDTKKISKTLFGHEHPIESFDDVAHGIKKHINPKHHQAIIDKFAERGEPHAVERLKGILSGKKIDEGKQELHKELLKVKDRLDKISSDIRHGEHMNYGGPTAAINKRTELKDLHNRIIQRLKSQNESTFSNSELRNLPGKSSGSPISYETKKSPEQRKKEFKDWIEFSKRKNKKETSESKEETHHAAVTLPMGASPSTHVGHQDLVDEMLRHAPPEHSHVSLSDKADYLSKGDRKTIMQKQSPEHVQVHVVHGAGESIRAAYNRLPEGRKVLHLVGGPERQGMLDGLKKSLEAGKVKEMEGRHWDEVHVHNPKVSRRTTSNGEKTSGTNFRKALQSGDEQTVKEHLGLAYSPALSKHLKAGIKSGHIQINRKS